MRFTTMDGRELAGRSYTQVVQGMSELKFNRPRSLQSYRRATARRAKQVYGVVVSTDDDRSFVLDLCRHGLLKRR